MCSDCSEFKLILDYYSQKKYSKKRGNYIYYHPECKECTKKRSADWTNENFESHTKSFKKYMKTDGFKKYSKRNAKEFKDYMVIWRKENKDKISKYNKKYSDGKTHVISERELSLLYTYCNEMCMYCGMSEIEAKDKYGKKLFKDHFYNEGSNGIDNCILCCNGCSSSKRDHDFEDWYIESNPVYSEERHHKVMEWIHSFE